MINVETGVGEEDLQRTLLQSQLKVIVPAHWIVLVFIAAQV